MGSLYGLLALQGIVEKAPGAVAVWYGLILLCAFVVGVKKGFRKVAWGGFYWILASVSFFALHKVLADLNPLAAILSGKNAGAASFIWSAILLISCIGAALILYGVLAVVFRPREVEIDEDDQEQVDSYGFVYEDEREEDGLKKAPTIYIKGGGIPGICARVAGGFLAMVNVASVLMVITSLFLIVVGQTSLSEGALGKFLALDVVQKASKLSVTYGLDFITIGVILFIAYKGYDTGFFGSLYAIAGTIGILIVGDIAFGLPFAGEKLPFIGKLVGRCGELFTALKPEIANILAKVTAGVILAVAGLIFMAVIAFLLRKTTEAVESHKTTLLLDEVAAVAVYLVIGALVVTAIWSAFYLLDYCGIIFVSKGFNEDSTLAGEFFSLAEHYLKDFADKYLLRFRAG